MKRVIATATGYPTPVPTWCGADEIELYTQDGKLWVSMGVECGYNGVEFDFDELVKWVNEQMLRT